MRNVIRTFLLLGIVLCLTAPALACRFWGLVGEGYPSDLIADQLRDGSASNFVRLSGSYRNGWGIAYFPPAGFPLELNRPIIRRGGPPPSNPAVLDFSLAVDEMAAIGPRAALAHIRRCSSGPCGIPDPHPFQHDGSLFAHNGTISDSLLTALLTAGDPRYLVDHPPDYTGNPVDSELYFLYLLKFAAQHPEFPRTESFQRALSDLATLTGSRLNCVLTAGDSLFAVRCATNDGNDPVRYYPADEPSSPFWVIASQPLGSFAENWATIPARTLALFVPGAAPRFYPIVGDTASTTGIHEAVGCRVGAATPNPARDAVVIPLPGGRAGQSATIEVWDAQGRLLWKDGPRPLGRGERALRWDTRDRAGRRVPCGIYFCRVSVDSRSRDQTISILR